MAYNKSETGGRHIGFFCSYVPVEIFVAAGIQPVRLQAGTDPIEQADSYISANYCLFIKRILDSGLRKEYSDMAGMVFINSCDGMRRLHDLWLHYLDTPFTFFLELPRNRNETGIDYFADHLRELKDELEMHFKVDITDEKLKEAISATNTRRELMAAIFQKQKSIPSPFSGTQIQNICLEESKGLSSADKLSTFLESNDTDSPKANGGPRILVAGNTGYKPVLANLIDQTGASVVAFDTCDGLQHYTEPVEMESDSDSDTDPYKALARRYLLKPACPRMPNTEERIGRLKQLVEEYAVDGIVYSSIKFCDHSLFETPHLEKQFAGSRVPLLLLENDYSWSDIERVKTRVEAFVEMIPGKSQV